jgi:hypothetical protein
MIRLFVLSVVVFVGCNPEICGAAAKKPQSPKDGKRVIQLDRVQATQIEMPDGTVQSFGEDFQAALTTRLFQTGKYILADSEMNERQSAPLATTPTDPYLWSGTWVPSAMVSFEIKAVTFQTGTRGEKMFYGFDERFRNRYNDGTGREKNEFPLRLNSNQTNWFGNTFNRKGLPPFDSRSGLDLGDGFNIDFLYAWLTVKYARYHAELRVLMEMKLPTSTLSSLQTIAVKGEGFFFDVAGAYDQYSAGISFARTDAMSHALKNVISGSYEAIDGALSALPLMARVDGILADGTVLLGTGPNSEIQTGMSYEPLDRMGLQVAVESSGLSGSIGKIVKGNVNNLGLGQLLRQVPAQEVAPFQVRSSSLESSDQKTPSLESIQLPSANLPPASLEGLVPGLGRAQAILKSFAELAFLPYRIARYFLYNQSYHRRSDLGSSGVKRLEKEKWVRQIGLDLAPKMAEGAPVVAILDSGIDYNHPAIHPALWINLAPTLDFRGYQDYYGWDFISNDARPYDDGYHGTQLASLVLQVAPSSKVMPIKIFNPWGITSSAAIYAGFQYAVDHGAQVILCGWSTSVRSAALEEGVAYARDHQVPVVTAAGDGGVSLEVHPFYPASYSLRYDNLLVVTSVTEKDEVRDAGVRGVNFGNQTVHLAAPGESISVAEPRSNWSRISSSSLPAAIVAGALAREISFYQVTGNYKDWINDLLNGSDPITALNGKVKNGLRLHIRR